MTKIKDIKFNINSNDLKIIDVPIKFGNPFKVNLKEFELCFKKFKSCSLFYKKKYAKAIINCPINKKLIQKSKKVGVTEFL